MMSAKSLRDGREQLRTSLPAAVHTGDVKVVLTVQSLPQILEALQSAGLTQPSKQLPANESTYAGLSQYG
jgi:hypothetical protein